MPAVRSKATGDHRRFHTSADTATATKSSTMPAVNPGGTKENEKRPVCPAATCTNILPSVCGSGRTVPAELCQPGAYRWFKNTFDGS